MLLTAVLAPFLGAALVAAAGRRLGRQVGWLAAASFLPAVALALQAGAVTGGDVPRQALEWVPQLGLALEFRLDGLSLLFATLIALVGVVTCAYAVAYLGKGENAGRFFAYLLAFGGSMLGLVLSENLILTFAFWELTSITSFLLIGFWHTRAASRDGAMKALLVTALGGLGLLAVSVLIAAGGGSANLARLDVAAFRESAYFLPATLLVLLAAFTKSAQVPFHLWLPTAMEAPTPVSAFLHSATMVKAGVFLVARLGFLFAGPLWTALVVGFGLATLFWGAYLALRQVDLKALLAYSTVSQLGLLLALYGINEPGAAFAATAHLINHAAFKATLFYVVGIIDHETGTRDLRLLGGLRRVMPFSFALSLVAALSMAGIPPLGGFVSKELFFEEMLHGTWPMWAIAAAGSAATVAYSLRFLTVFFGPLRAPEAGHVHEAPPALWAPVVPFALATVLFGVLPGTAEAVVRVAGGALAFADYKGHLKLWHGLTAALLLSAAVWGAGALLFAARRPVEALQGKLEPSWNANTVYYRLLGVLEAVAIWLTRVTQGRPLPDQLRVILAAYAGVIGYGLLRAGVPLPEDVAGVPLAMLPIALLLVAGAAGVLAARDAIS
ncbi:MAG TPA: proton-conducting transporter membrane subunit, partial [Deinococcales bacterium]|nr:proton-conducting transporter membrane subunit [Deinococcales bacterium]